MGPARSRLFRLSGAGLDQFEGRIDVSEKPLTHTKLLPPPHTGVGKDPDPVGFLWAQWVYQPDLVDEGGVWFNGGLWVVHGGYTPMSSSPWVQLGSGHGGSSGPHGNVPPKLWGTTLIFPLSTGALHILPVAASGPPLPEATGRRLLAQLHHDPAEAAQGGRVRVASFESYIVDGQNPFRAIITLGFLRWCRISSIHSRARTCNTWLSTSP